MELCFDLCNLLSLLFVGKNWKGEMNRERERERERERDRQTDRQTEKGTYRDKQTETGIDRDSCVFFLAQLNVLAFHLFFGIDNR